MGPARRLLGREPAPSDSAEPADHLFPGEPPSEKFYNKGCRCADCRDRHAEEARRRYHAHKGGTFSDQRRRPGSRKLASNEACGCPAAEAVLRDPTRPTLSPGSQVALWQLARRGEMTLADLADLTRTSLDLAGVRMDDLVDSGLAALQDESQARYKLVVL